MAVKVRIPAPLRRLTKDQSVVEVEGQTVADILVGLEKGYPGIKERLCDETGQIRRFINVFVNGEDIRFKEGAKTSVPSGAEVSIVPAIAGGTSALCAAPSRRRSTEISDLWSAVCPRSSAQGAAKTTGGR
jgi:molybdopterin synthase sulfur carrier subunit